MSRSEKLKRASRSLVKKLNALEFSSPVEFVYNPLEYARKSYEVYLDRFASTRKKVLFLGMNPGPFGMAQTGVPFGEIAHVRDWMHICEKVKKPPVEHPKRKIEGFDCEKSEVSGRRLWGYFSEKYPRPEDFFKDHFILNYCPLVFLEESGRNRTPDKIPADEAQELNALCDKFLLKCIEVLEPKSLIGVGAFAEKCLKRVVNEEGFQIGKILHPSPASPVANRGWAPQAEKQLRELGLSV